MNIETNKLNKMQISDYYLWSKYIIDNKINSIDDLKNFCLEDYHFSEKLSSEKELIFTR